jgi:hypothetical protein
LAIKKVTPSFFSLLRSDVHKGSTFLAYFTPFQTKIQFQILAEAPFYTSSFFLPMQGAFFVHEPIFYVRILQRGMDRRFCASLENSIAAAA